MHSGTTAFTPSPAASSPAPPPISLGILQADMGKLLSEIVDQQLGVMRTKLVEVKTIPEGVPFIHVLKAVTPVKFTLWFLAEILNLLLYCSN